MCRLGADQGEQSQISGKKRHTPMLWALTTRASCQECGCQECRKFVQAVKQSKSTILFELLSRGSNFVWRRIPDGLKLYPDG